MQRRNIDLNFIPGPFPNGVGNALSQTLENIKDEYRLLWGADRAEYGLRLRNPKSFAQDIEAFGDRCFGWFLAFHFQRDVPAVIDSGENFGDAIVIEIECVPFAAAVV